VQRSEQDNVEKIIEALIFSFSIYAMVNLFAAWKPVVYATKSGDLTTYTFSTDRKFLAILALFTVIVPVATGAILHHDLIMKLLRVLQITDKTARDSLWQDVFIEQKRFLVVHMKDERRIYGWPMYYSNNPKEGFLYLYNPAWIDDDGNYIECGTHGVLIQMENIDFIEFIKEKSEKNYPVKKGEENVQQTSG
jgi:hypothetical protein